MHPELFELKALVAGRLDAHRRREIDDHLGSCADCSRHYVALMLGSTSPKTAEAEAREGLISTAAGAVSALPLNGGASAAYGIDAPIAPSVPRAPTRLPHNNSPALETEFPPASARTQVPVSASLVDAIAKLRAESDGKNGHGAAGIVSHTPSGSTLVEPSIFTPTPPDGISIVPPRPAATPPTAELPGFMTRPVSASPARSVAAQPELVVTFSSTPTRLTSYRSPATVAAITPSSRFEYVSQAVSLPAPAQLTEFSITDTRVSRKPKPVMLGAIIGGVAVALLLAVSGYKYFKSSVSQAAATAAAAAAKQVEAAAARTAPQAPVAAAPVPAPVQTRIVYVREPARRTSESRGGAEAQSAPSGPTAPISSVALPDVNVSTGVADNALQANTQRNATSELTRSARATALRTAAPRPY